jgi:hypothetical protein
MTELIRKLFEAINLLKDFSAGYSSSTFHDGLMMITYKGKNYAVKIVEMDENEDPFNAIDCVKYYFR